MHTFVGVKDIGGVRWTRLGLPVAAFAKGELEHIPLPDEVWRVLSEGSDPAARVRGLASALGQGLAALKPRGRIMLLSPTFWLWDIPLHALPIGPHGECLADTFDVIHVAYVDSRRTPVPASVGDSVVVGGQFAGVTCACLARNRLKVECYPKKAEFLDRLFNGPPARFIHLAGHGVVIHIAAEASLVTFADGILTAAELSLLPLAGCQVFFLNACDTAGAERGLDDASISLETAALTAGAAAAVVTTRPVDASLAPEVATAFYRRLLPRADGALATARAFCDTVNALRAAKPDPGVWAPYRITVALP
jgi:hypothetical protein